MLKVSTFRGFSEEYGQLVTPIHCGRGLDKLASPLLPEVVTYIQTLRPSPSSIYVLVNALGAGEYWGSNVNADHFPEAALIHKPDRWMNNPLVDRVLAKDWAYGFPTFYNAHPYTHHRNKDSSRAYGEIELATWNPVMKRVELVVRVDKDKCERFGGTSLWSRLSNGDYLDVSMGSKVPFDTCSICLDTKTYHEALATYDPKTQRFPGEAVLAYMKKRGRIRGVAITRADYCDHMRLMPNRLMDDGRRVFVYNDFPRFFDISFVFIGADKTAKTLMKIASPVYYSFDSGDTHLSVDVARTLGYQEVEEKTASAIDVGDEILKRAFLGKRSEITKDVVPSQFGGKAIPALTKSEPTFGGPVMDMLKSHPFQRVLATLTGLGMVLRPDEFQDLALCSAGKSDLANELSSKGIVFSKQENKFDMPIDTNDFDPRLAFLMGPMMGMRSALAPHVERRIIMIQMSGSEKKASAQTKAGLPSLVQSVLDKIGSAYNGYRESVLEQMPFFSEQLANTLDPELRKMAAASPEEVFLPLSAKYLIEAYWDEVD